MRAQTVTKFVVGSLVLAGAFFGFVYLAVCEFARAVDLDGVDFDG
jgi:hypothetical protein